MAWTYRCIAHRDLLSAVRRHFDIPVRAKYIADRTDALSQALIRQAFVTQRISCTVAAVVSVVTSGYVLGPLKAM